MLAALEAIPEDERFHMGLDVEEMRTVPLAQRLVKLQELWNVRQQELKEAYDAIPKVNELLMARIEVLQATDSSESALLLALTDLEDLLSDIDMARDFHSLEGFPVLTSMLNLSQTEAVREMAAWVIGTAVKNEPSHQLWVLEVRKHIVKSRACHKSCHLREHARYCWGMRSPAHFTRRLMKCLQYVFSTQIDGNRVPV